MKNLDLEKDINYCPHCGTENKLVLSSESATDYYVVGETYRCKKCKWGFGFILLPIEKITIKPKQ